MNKKICITLLHAISLMKVFGQESAKIIVDSSTVIQQKFSPNIQETYAGDEYNYDVMEGEAENLITKAIKWFFKKLGELIGIDIDPGTSQIFEYFIYAFLIAFGIYIVVKLLMGNEASSFLTKKSGHIAPITYEEEHIENIDLEALLKEALNTKNYRLAIRYQYLITLKKLSNNGKIIWDFEKTNKDYYQEIKEQNIKDAFKKISYTYEYVWYGEFTLTPESYQISTQDFTIIEKLLSNA